MCWLPLRPVPEKLPPFSCRCSSTCRDFPRKKPGPARVLVLTPTRELAIQVADQARALAKHTNLKIFTITGGISYDEHAELLGKTQDIVVATTGAPDGIHRGRALRLPCHRVPDP